MMRPVAGLLLVCVGCAVPDDIQERQLAASSLHHAPAWALTERVSQPRLFPRVTELGDGRALVSGGGDGPVGTPTGEIFDPETNGYDPVTPAPTPLGGHLAVRLQDGTVLVAGGMGTGAFNFPFHPDDGHLAVSKRSYLYDPATDRWTRTGDLPYATFWLTTPQPAVLLGDGRVMVCGGGRADDSYRVHVGFAFDQYPATRKTYVWDPDEDATVDDGAVVRGRWIEAGPMAESHRFVDVFPGGFELEEDPSTVVATPIPATVGSLVDGHRVFSAGTEGHTLVLLDDGRVLKVGGRLYFPAHHYAVPTMEIFDPDPNELSWTTVSPLPSSPDLTLADEDYGDGSRVWVGAARLGDGRVLIAGGDTAGHAYEPPSPGYAHGRFVVTTEHARRSSLIYDPVTDRYEHGPGLDMVLPRGAHDLMRLRDGALLAIGGHRLQDAATDALFTEPAVERFDPATLTWSRLDGADMPTRTVTSEHYGLTNAHGPVAVGLTFLEVPASAVVGDDQYLLVSGWDWMGRRTDLSLLFSPSR